MRLVPVLMFALAPTALLAQQTPTVPVVVVNGEGIVGLAFPLVSRGTS